MAVEIIKKINYSIIPEIGSSKTGKPIQDKYLCEKCPHKTPDFGNLTDHVRSKDCETKKQKNYERGKSQRLLNHIKCYPGKHSIPHIKKLFGIDKNRSTNNSISYLINTGKIEKREDKLYPVMEGSI